MAHTSQQLAPRFARASMCMKGHSMPTGCRVLFSLVLGLAFSSSAAFTQAQISVNGACRPHPCHSRRGPPSRSRDKGALYSWQATQQCYESHSDPNYWSGSYTYTQTNPCPTDPGAFDDDGGGPIVRDVVWDPGSLPWNGLEPILQLEGEWFSVDGRRRNHVRRHGAHQMDGTESNPSGPRPRRRSHYR